jgi:uncharacterized phage infection (PIP) family protein YhgE
MENLDPLLRRQLDQLSAVTLTPDLMDRIEAGKLAERASAIVTALNNTNDSIETLSGKGMLKTFMDTFGPTEKIMANPDKALVESAKFNVGLLCLLVLYAKALTNQRELITSEHAEAASLGERLRDTGNQLTELQKLMQEQTELIRHLPKGDENVKNELEKVRSEAMSELAALSAKLDEQLGQLPALLESKASSSDVSDLIAQASEAQKKDAEAWLKTGFDEMAEQVKTALADVTKVSESINTSKNEFAEIVMHTKSELEKRMWWPIGISAICIILVIVKIFDLF